MPSPRKVSPSPSLSACTSFLNDRSIVRPSADSWDPNYIARISLHLRGQPQRQDRKGDEDNQPDKIGQDERNDAPEYRRKGDVLDDAFYHEHVHPDRRMDQTELDGHHDDNAEPDRVEAQMRDDRKDDRDGQDDHGHRVHQAAEHQVHHHDQRQDAVAAEPESGQEFRHLLRRLRDREEIAEQQRADQHGEYGSGSARCLEERAEDAVSVETPAQQADQESAARADTAGFGRREARQERQPVKAADHEYKQQQRRPDVFQRGTTLRPGAARTGWQEFRPSPSDDGDRGHVHADRQQAGNDSGDEQLADVLLGDDAVDREHG